MVMPVSSKSKVILGLLGSLIGCFSTISFNGKGHKISGLMLGAFSAMHIYQYRKRFFKHLGVSREKMLPGQLGGALKRKIINNFTKLEVLYFSPGRIRIYARQVHNNSANAKAVADYLRGVKEIRNISVNPQTGSVLIEYSPEEARGNKFLRELEELLKKHGRR